MTFTHCIEYGHPAVDGVHAGPVVLWQACDGSFSYLDAYRQPWLGDPSELEPTRSVFVDAASGSDSNKGYSASLPLATMTEALLVARRDFSSVIHATGFFNEALVWTSTRSVKIVGHGMTVDGGGASETLKIQNGHVSLVGGRYVNAGQHAIELGGTASNSPTLAAWGVTAVGQISGFATIQFFGELHCSACVGRGVTNDGFNIHGAAGVVSAAVLLNCTGSDCGDEGASPHDDTSLRVVGGRFERNGSAGLTAVGNSRMDVVDAIVSDNGPDGGARWLGSSSGTTCGMVTQGNGGPGIEIANTASVNGIAPNSSGNAAADILDTFTADPSQCGLVRGNTNSFRCP